MPEHESLTQEPEPVVQRANAVGSVRLARSPARAVLALQRTIGNAATARLLARSSRPAYEHPVDNPVLRDTIYIARDLALRDFVNMFHEMELRDMTDPAERGTVITAANVARQQQIERLRVRIKGNETKLSELAAKPAKPNPTEAERDEREADKKLVRELTTSIARDHATIKLRTREIAEKSSEKAWWKAVEWESQHYGDPMAGKVLMDEVKRLFQTSKVPDWLKPLVRDYAGMRYYGLAKPVKNAKGEVVRNKKKEIVYKSPSAHGSYYNPGRLLYIIKESRGLASDPAAQKALRATSPEAAIAELERMHDAGEIPAWAWHKIVRLTELRTWYAETGWEDETKEEPGTDASDWVSIMHRWTDKDAKVKGFFRGATGWRAEMNRRNVLVTTRMFCNEISEAAQRQRGIKLETGGIQSNARDFERFAAAAAEPGAAPGVAGSYFRQPTSKDDIRPGASLFFLETGKWAVEKPSSNMVLAVSGVTYPMPVPAEYKAWEAATAKYETEKKRWDARAAKATTEAKKAKLGLPPVKPDIEKPEKPDVLPKDEEVVEGWTYTVKPGLPITRHRMVQVEEDGELVDKTITQWMQWQHQATVLAVMPGDRVFTLETTDNLPGEGAISATGFRVRALDSLLTKRVFVGYAPGTADAQSGTAVVGESVGEDEQLMTDDEPVILDDEPAAGGEPMAGGEPVILDEAPADATAEPAPAGESAPRPGAPADSPAIDDAKLLELMMGAFKD